VGLVLGFISIFLILFFVAAMALAEWADQDVVDYFMGRFNRKKASAPAVKAAVAADRPVKSASRSKALEHRPVSGRRLIQPKKKAAKK
jgi:hypothetical protein